MPSKRWCPTITSLIESGIISSLWRRVRRVGSFTSQNGFSAGNWCWSSLLYDQHRLFVVHSNFFLSWPKYCGFLLWGYSDCRLLFLSVAIVESYRANIKSTVINNKEANVFVWNIPCANVCNVKRNFLTATWTLKERAGCWEKKPDLVTINHERHWGNAVLKTNKQKIIWL